MREDDKGSSAGSRKAREPADQSSAPLIGGHARTGQNVASSQLSENEALGGSQAVSPDMQQFIGRQLRAVYDDVAKQPIPDRFLELMRQLDNKSRAS